jgi:hypothetical protein
MARNEQEAAVARICLDQGKRTIADAEPAVERWGFLQ